MQRNVSVNNQTINATRIKDAHPKLSLRDKRVILRELPRIENEFGKYTSKKVLIDKFARSGIPPHAYTSQIPE